MARIRSGERIALLVIDVQNGVFQNAHNRNGIIANITKVIDKARETKTPIIFVQHIDDNELPENSAQWQVIEEIEIFKEDYRIMKRYNSAFEDTDLDLILGKLEITKIIVIGAATNWCIRATTFSALNKGYDIILISDAHTTEDLEISDGKIILANNIIDEFNIGIKYIEYPGIETSVINTCELFSK
jgi:nicotinamidase-related amidase